MHNPVPDIDGKNLHETEGGAKTGYSVEGDVGLAGDIADAYLGYMYCMFDAGASAARFFFYGASDIEGEWTINQWILGARLHARRSNPGAIMPFAGLALSWSRVTADASGIVFGDTVSTSAQSDSEVSPMLEGGFLVRLSSVAEFLAALQYHDFDASFDHPLWNGSLNIAFVAFQGGVVYHL